MSDYLQSELAFYDDRIEVADSGVQIMMSWERPLMRRMAEIACIRRGDVLEIGFGMGISCDEVQRHRPRSHTIVEAHPQIVERALSWAQDKPNTRIIPGRWQDVVHELERYDGVSFDVFGGEGQREAFFENLGRWLRPKGTATLWLADDRSMPEALAEVLERGGFRHHLVRVSAIPDKRCTYSQTNEFYIPIITYR